jgi:hypothetical protein
MFRNCIFASLVAAFISMFAMGSRNTIAAIVYWQNFDTETPGVPTVGTGTLVNRPAGATNTTGDPGTAVTPSVFDPTGGIFGGVMNNTATPTDTLHGTQVASTGLVGGGASPLDSLPDQTGGGVGSMNQFTITFWAKAETLANTTTSHDRRMLIIGSAGASKDVVTANQNIIGFVADGPNFTPELDIYQKMNSWSTSVTADAGITGADISLDTWTFIALTYDGTSSFGNDSTVQSTLTEGASSLNGQVYLGTDANSVSRFAVPFTTTPGDATAASSGTFEFGNAAVLILGNRTNSTTGRVFDGWIDDVRIYDSTLSPTEVEEARLQGLQGIVGPPSVPGDFTGDGNVDGDDFAIWQMNFPTHELAELGDGDADGDGDVDGADFVVWQTNFDGGPESSPVPEPTGIMLACCGFITGLAWRRRCKGQRRFSNRTMPE